MITHLPFWLKMGIPPISYPTCGHCWAVLGGCAPIVYPPVINRGHGKSPIKGGFRGKIHRRWTVHGQTPEGWYPLVIERSY